jgi:hypothetical protein
MLCGIQRTIRKKIETGMVRVDFGCQCAMFLIPRLYCLSPTIISTTSPLRSVKTVSISPRKMKGDNIPIVEAVPISSTNASGTNGIYVVDLPIGPADLGFQVQGTPPQISVINKDSPVFGQICVGHYIHGIIMSEIEIVNLTDPVHVTQLIQANAKNPRRLMISSSPFYVDGSIDNTNAVRSAIYKHRLPASSSLGFAMKGFPPSITVVAPTSPLAGRLHPGQTVEALLVPGQPVMNLAAGAFTSAKVEERLLATCQLGGRQLVVKDGHNPQREKGSSRPLDDCVIS